MYVCMYVCMYLHQSAAQLVHNSLKPKTTNEITQMKSHPSVCLLVTRAFTQFGKGIHTACQLRNAVCCKFFYSVI